MKKKIMLSEIEITKKIEHIETKKKNLEKKLDKLNDLYIELSQKKNFRRSVAINKKRGRLISKIQHCKNDLEYLNNNEVEKINIFKKINNNFKRMPYRKQKQIFGVLFVIPWFIGFAVFFASSLGTTLWWSLNDMAPKQGGGFNFIFSGLENYINLFTKETLSGTTVLEVLTSSIIDILIDLPTIIIFSIFIAVLLNTKFKGHQLVKAIFFIPVVYNMTVINNTMSGTFGALFGAEMDSGFQLSNTFSNFLMQIGIGGGLVEFLMSAVDRIFLIINKSGIQIIMFIAALQSIPNHLYESAKVEGATKYEMFWKVTIPMVSPMILTTLVYTIVDSFGSSDIMNFLTVNSQGTTMATNQPGMYSAISVVYFLINLLIIVFGFLLLRKRVFYYD
ncbi:MAG: ABC transporter permease subunit [Candidatus Izemoplasmatales bacterium]|nr:ABC transporter permease subunit [Candidatus Izemoplasmatales bacterium]